MNRQQIHEKVIEHYGILEQIEKLQEEAGELCEALHYCQERHKAFYSSDRLNLISELADASNCVE